MSSNPDSLLGNEDPRGRVEDARPLDRGFYDRNLSENVAHSDLPVSQQQLGSSGQTKLTWSLPSGEDYSEIMIKRDGAVIAVLTGHVEEYILSSDLCFGDMKVDAVVTGSDPDEAAERREYHRHRTMFWELFADWFVKNGDKSPYRRWYENYYNGRQDKAHETWWPGYGSPDEPFPFADTEDMKPLPKSPGLNTPPEHGDSANAPDLTADDLNFGHPAFDRTQEAFGAARGCYEVWTDVFVDITDAFRGGYQNGDMRWIFKTPRNDEYKYVEELNELLYGLKNGWAWTAIQGTKEFQCATLGGYEFGRLVDLGSYIDYRGEWADFHPSDRNQDGGTKGDDDSVLNSKNHRFGNWEDFGIVDKTYTGPLKAASEEPLWESDSEFPGFKSDGAYNTGTHHGVICETKVGYGAPGAADVVHTQSHTTNKRIWNRTHIAGYEAWDETADSCFRSEARYGSSITVQDEINSTDHPGEFWSKVVNGSYSREERLTGTAMHTVLRGDDHEHCYGSKFDVLLGTSNSLHVGAETSAVLAAQAELLVGAVLEIFIGGKVSIALAATLNLGVDKEYEVRSGKIRAAVDVTEVAVQHNWLCNFLRFTSADAMFLSARVSL